MRIQKVKVSKDGKITIEHEIKNRKNEWDQYTMVCADEAKPTFYSALQALREHVDQMCELNCPLDRIKVTGVSFSYGGPDEVMGATMIAQKILLRSNAPLNIVTPHKASEPFADFADENQLLSDQCIGDLQTVLSEVEDYIKGDRAQMNLFSSSNSDKKQQEKTPPKVLSVA